MKTPKINYDLVNSIVAVLKSLPEAERRNILAHFASEKEKSPPSLIGLGRVGSSTLSRSALVDYCKRVEFCYKTWPGHHQGQKVFIPWDKTELFLTAVLQKHGEKLLHQYVEHLESCYARGSWSGFSRPERMVEHFKAWVENPTHPARPNEGVGGDLVN
jgi:hypothetical protein